MARILVIDDEAELLDMMRLVLERRAGHQVILSADGADGLAKARADPPDLAIIDVMMPGMTGYEVCRRLRADPATAYIPILILTARAQPMDREAAMEAGADAYLAKPVVMPELLKTVDELLTKRAKKSPLPGIIALLSLRGGVGVTTLAVNLAVALAVADRTPTCLADLCPSSGHVALQLGMRPEPNWSALTQPPTLETLNALLLQHKSGLHILAAPFFPVIGQGLSREVMQTVLSLLAQRFATIVLDLPSVLNETTITALEMASLVGLVLTAEPPSIQTTVGTLRVLGRWADKLRVILNQVVPGPQPPADAIARALKTPLIGVVPFDAAQAQALARGTPLALSSPDALLTQAVRALIQSLAAAPQGVR
ncbi:MAG: response regulator [Anaerolineae bacterium]|nr:response regulator [Anaerolineae bacterium]